MSPTHDDQGGDTSLSRRGFVAGSVLAGTAASGLHAATAASPAAAPPPTAPPQPADPSTPMNPQPKNQPINPPIDQPTNPRLFTFLASREGPWAVTEVRAVVGEPLARTDRLAVVPGAPAPAALAASAWALRGVGSNERYVTRPEKQELLAKQAALGRPEATRAVLIPIRKNAAWWAMTQDERRAVFEERSHHTAIGLRYLPAIARRLHHCRDLAQVEPFDFLTWFDFAPRDATAFDDLLAALRATEEWRYVDREFEVRVERAS